MLTILSVGRGILAAAFLFLTLAAGEAREAWITLPGCQLVRNDSNDGDSFHVKSADGKKYIFRLYFADAAETDPSFPDRVHDQAMAFGLTTAQTLELGEAAKRFTQEKLAQPFTVRTAMHEAMGRSKKPRFYAFVAASEGDLSELLVANGLARLHGNEAKPTGMSSPQAFGNKLKRLETEARQQRVGAWGASFGRMTARVAQQPAKTGPDSFDSFFHPERVVLSPEVGAEANAVEPSTAAAPASGTKLNLNTATSEQLLGIKGVGPVLASRIIAARPYKSADDLRHVKGIGEKKFAQIRPFLQEL